ncbi:hypothetical protein AN958_12726 [Leucoagaricus sp. SymC.cos]|nr:hypothetical protein AN958_12726 [Leucoagaricus sp. SymC.cos]
MKFLDQPSVPLQFFLPLLIVLSISTVFSATLTWNDFRLLSSLRGNKELENVPSTNEAPLDLTPAAQLVGANGHYGMSADEEWDSLLPSNHATGIRLGSSEEGQFISAYHQLSCLNALRKLYMNPGWVDDAKRLDTAHHCLNVLRQAVLCNADTTLEPSHPEKHSNGKVVAAASGMDVLHVCKNWEKLRTLSEKDGFANSSSVNHASERRSTVTL